MSVEKKVSALFSLLNRPVSWDADGVPTIPATPDLEASIKDLEGLDDTATSLICRRILEITADLPDLSKVDESSQKLIFDIQVQLNFLLSLCEVLDRNGGRELADSECKFLLEKIKNNKLLLVLFTRRSSDFSFKNPRGYIWNHVNELITET